MNEDFKQWESLCRLPAYSQYEKELRDALRSSLGIIYQMQKDMNEWKARACYAVTMLEDLVDRKEERQGELHA